MKGGAQNTGLGKSQVARTALEVTAQLS